MHVLYIIYNLVFLFVCQFIDSAMVQVKFGPTSHCVEWSVSRTV